jgi:hypothetical protein
MIPYNVIKTRQTSISHSYPCTRYVVAFYFCFSIYGTHKLTVEMQNHAEFLDVDFGYDDPVIGPGESSTLNCFHPSSGIKAKVYSFDNFERRAADFLVPPPDSQPWSPFKSRLEFEIAEIMLEVGFNNQQTNRLVKLCHRCAVGKEKLTFKNHKDIHNMWEAALHCITKVVVYPFSSANESDIA